MRGVEGLVLGGSVCQLPSEVLGMGYVSFWCGCKTLEKLFFTGMRGCVEVDKEGLDFTEQVNWGQQEAYWREDAP